MQLRRVSKHVKQLAEAELCRHLVIYPDYGIVMTTRRGMMVNVGVGTLEEGGRVQANPTFNGWYNDYIDTYRPMRRLRGNFPFAEDSDDAELDDDEDEDDDDDDDGDDEGDNDHQESAQPDFDSDDGDPDGYDIDEENVPDLGAILFPDDHFTGDDDDEEFDSDSELSFSSEDGPEEAMALMQMLVQQNQALGNESIVPPNVNGPAGEALAAAIAAAANGNGGVVDPDESDSHGSEGGWETFSDHDDDEDDDDDQDEDGLEDEDDILDHLGFGGVESAYADTGDEYSSEEEMGIEDFSHRLPEQAATAMKNVEVVDIFQRPPYRGIIRLMRATDKVHTVRYHLPYAQLHSFSKCLYASNAPRVVQFSLMAPIGQYDLFDEGNPGSALGRSTRFVDHTKLRRGCKKAVFNVAYDVGCKGLRNGRIRFDDFPDTVEEVVLILTKTAWDMKPTAKGNKRDARPYDGKGWFEEFVLTEASRPRHKLTIVGLQDVPPGALSLKRNATAAEKVARFDYRMHEAKRLLEEDDFTKDIYFEMEGPSENWDEEFAKYMANLECLTHDEYKARIGAREWSIENEILPGLRHGS